MENLLDPACNIRITVPTLGSCYQWSNWSSCHVRPQCPTTHGTKKYKHNCNAKRPCWASHILRADEQCGSPFRWCTPPILPQFFFVRLERKDLTAWILCSHSVLVILCLLFHLPSPLPLVLVHWHQSPHILQTYYSHAHIFSDWRFLATIFRKSLASQMIACIVDVTHANYLNT